MIVNWPDLVGDGVVFLGISVILAALGIGCFGARTYTSWQCTKRFLLDYWLSLLTFTLCVFSQAFFAVSITFGLGSHVRDLAHSDIVVALHTSWASQLTGIVAAVTGKLSIIAFLNQIRGHHQGRPWFLYFIGVSNIVVNIIVVVFILSQCTPLERLWDEKVPGDCKLRTLNHYYAYFQGGFSAFSDAALALYPIRLISRLRVSTRMKIGLSFLLGFGLLAAAVALVKTVQLTNLAHHDESADITFFVARLSLATLVEAWIVMAVGCIPTLRPLTKAVMNMFRGPPGNKAKERTERRFSGYNGCGMPSSIHLESMRRAESGSMPGSRKEGNSTGGRRTTSSCGSTTVDSQRSIDDRDFAENQRGLALARGSGDYIVVPMNVFTGYGRSEGTIRGKDWGFDDGAKKYEAERRVRRFAYI